MTGHLRRAFCRYMCLTINGLNRKSTSSNDKHIPIFSDNPSGIFKHNSYSAGTKSNGGLRGGATRRI